MQPLMVIGLACVVSAVVDGGLKLATIEVPIISSTKRQVLLALVGGVLIIGSMAPIPTASKPRASSTKLSPGAWTIKNTLYQHSLGARLCIFEVTLDGEQLKSESVSVGQAVPIDPSVTGGTRLVLTIDPYVLA